MGSVQTNYLFKTTKGKFVLRYYENRSKKSVEFESNVIKFLKRHRYPCPAPIENKNTEIVGIYKIKPYIIFEFVEGRTLENPNKQQQKQFIKKAAELHNITKNFKPANTRYRFNYGINLVKNLAESQTRRINSIAAKEKLKWLKVELLKLDLPNSLAKGVCHCDFCFTNVLYKDGKFISLIDFDDANFTYLIFDLVGLIESMAWCYDKEKVLNFNKAKYVVSEYLKYRTLNFSERKHLFDVYKLSILIDCVWYFRRGRAKDFYERQKIEFLNSIGRAEFKKRIFG
jgi:Ser/Thr protein kinase RdoA (MazF antagonist)